MMHLPERHPFLFINKVFCIEATGLLLFMGFCTGVFQATILYAQLCLQTSDSFFRANHVMGRTLRYSDCSHCGCSFSIGLRLISSNHESWKRLVIRKS